MTYTTLEYDDGLDTGFNPSALVEVGAIKYRRSIETINLDDGVDTAYNPSGLVEVKLEA